MCTKFANEWFKNANDVTLVSIFSADDMDIYQINLLGSKIAS